MALGACASGPAADGLEESIATLPAPIQGGYVDENDKGVVYVAHLDFGAIGGCTGSLLAPNVVLTARHCVAPIVNGDSGINCSLTTFGTPYSGSEFYVSTYTTVPYGIQGWHGCSEVKLPPADNHVCGTDVAILILSTPIYGDEATPLIPRIDEPLEAAENYSAVGFGQTYDNPNAPSGTRYRRDDLTINCVTELCSAWLVDQQSEWTGETGVCSGDSGGPAVDTLGRVTGVASRGASGCASPVYGYVYAWADWIKETTIYGANKIGADPPAWTSGWPTDPAYSQPVGGACDDPQQCPSGICIDNYCTRLCNDDAPCPQDYHCGPDGWCVRDEQPPTATDTGTDTASDTGAATGTDTGTGADSNSGNNAGKKSSEDDAGGCAVRPGTLADDPTKPIPWAFGVAALVGLTVLRRRKRR